MISPHILFEIKKISTGQLFDSEDIKNTDQKSNEIREFFKQSKISCLIKYCILETMANEALQKFLHDKKLEEFHDELKEYIKKIVQEETLRHLIQLEKNLYMREQSWRAHMDRIKQQYENKLSNLRIELDNLENDIKILEAKKLELIRSHGAAFAKTLDDYKGSDGKSLFDDWSDEEKKSFSEKYIQLCHENLTKKEAAQEKREKNNKRLEEIKKEKIQRRQELFLENKKVAD